MKRKKALFHLIGLSMSIFVGLAAAEIIIRIRSEEGLAEAWYAATEGEVPHSYHGNDQPMIADPVVGFRYNPAEANVNSLGLRGDELSREKAPGRPRIVVLGDSVSLLCERKHGTENIFPTLLAQEYGSRAEIVNAAVTGYTTHQQRLLLEHDLVAYEPDLVVVQYTLNDNEKFMHRWHRDKKLKLTEYARRTLLMRDGDPLAALPGGSYLLTRFVYNSSLLIDKRKYEWELAPGFIRAWRDDSWPLLEEQLVGIKTLTGRVGGRVLVMMVPYGPQLRESSLAEDRDYVLKPQRKMAALCARHDIALLDLFDAFQQAGGMSLFYDKIHLTRAGHRIVSDQLAQHLGKEGLVPDREDPAPESSP